MSQEGTLARMTACKSFFFLAMAAWGEERGRRGVGISERGAGQQGEPLY
jgi:hypothetical protein